MALSTDYGAFVRRSLHWAIGRWERGDALGSLAWSGVRLVLNLALLVVAVTGALLLGGPADLGWALVAIPVGIFLVLAVFVAPFQLWKQERRRAEAAERQLVPRISTDCVVRQVPGEKVASIVVQNRGSGAVLDCMGELKAVYALVDGRREQVGKVLPLYLRWSTRSQHEDSPKLTFNSAAELEVIGLESTFSGALEVRSFARRRAPAHRPSGGTSGLYWLEERARYVLDIEVSAANSSPVRKEYLLTIQPLGLRALEIAGGGSVPGPLPEMVFEILEGQGA